MAFCLLHLGSSAESLKNQVAQLKHLQLSKQEIYLQAAEFYHAHPVLLHIPEAKVSTRGWIDDEERHASLLALHKECKLHRAGQSVSTSTSLATNEPLSLDEVSFRS